jgi:hypothetical protein
MPQAVNRVWAGLSILISDPIRDDEAHQEVGWVPLAMDDPAGLPLASPSNPSVG